MKSSRITNVEVRRLRGRTKIRDGGSRQRQVQAIDLYDDQRKALLVPTETGETIGDATAHYLRIRTSDGIEGLYGPIDAVAGKLVLSEFSELLIGQDALAVSTIWDQLERHDRHARHGLLKAAISAVDNTLWDLRGRAFDAPVWQLLGGGSRRRVPAYASMLGTPLNADTVAIRAAEVQAEGYSGQKWFFEHGPASGPEGLRSSVDLVREVRNAVGPDEPIMFDAYHGWDLPFALAWAQRVAEYRPTWLEEPFLPNRHSAFAEFRRSTNIPLATGEHIYDRQEVLHLLQAGALGAVQCDPEWCGGVTELTRICAVAETFGVPVIPHGHGVHAAVHVIAAQSPEVCPKAEYLLGIMPSRHHFEVSPPAPVNGRFLLPKGPGFGIEFDTAKIDSDEALVA